MMRALLLLSLVCAAGCHDSSAGAGAPAAQPAVAPVASTSMLDRLPSSVQTSFAKDRKDSRITKIKQRMAPDGVVHYTIDSIDAKNVSHQDEYRADGVKVSNP